MVHNPFLCAFGWKKLHSVINYLDQFKRHCQWHLIVSDQLMAIVLDTYTSVKETTVQTTHLCVHCVCIRLTNSDTQTHQNLSSTCIDAAHTNVH